MAYGDFKDLTKKLPIKKKASDKILRDKAFNIAKNPKYEACQRGLASVVYNFFIRRFLVEQLKMRIYLRKN